MLLSIVIAAAAAQDLPAPAAERAALAVARVCEPFVAGRLPKPEAAAAAQQLDLRPLTRAGADFVFLTGGDLSVAFSGEGAMRDCSVTVDRASLEAVMAPLAAAAQRAGWLAMSSRGRTQLWLTPSHLMAVIDETYDKPETKIAIRFQLRGIPPQVGGRPADPLGLAVELVCIPFVNGSARRADARDLAIAGGMVEQGGRFAGYGLELTLGETDGVRRCSLIASGEAQAALGARAAEWKGPGYSLRIGSGRGASGEAAATLVFEALRAR